MCGIAGIVSHEPLSEDAAARVVSMRDALVHRGPDDQGLHSDPHAVFGHRRLSIVDLTTGQQPMANEDGTVWIVFNGEIYNHADLRRELQAHGHQFRTLSDTESIVHAYEQWGEDCVHRLRGMFAFAIWDAPRRRLLLVRDRLGIKPLYWTRAGNTLLFGSEIKALLASRLVEPQPNLDVLPEVLSTRYTSGADTLFRGVLKLLPGHVLVFENGEVKTRQYWDLPHSTGKESGDGARIIDRFLELLTESVRLRLMSDVPLGVFLSGGIDSSAIAAIMARLVGRPIQTFSVAFKDSAYNELPHAREVAHAIGAEAHEVVIDDGEFFGALPTLLWHEDEPIAHPSSIPLYFVSALARRSVTVVLTGEGSDELLAGYGKYARVAWNWRAGTVYAHTVPRSIRSLVANRLMPQLPESIGQYARRSFLAMDRTPQAMAFDNFSSVRLTDQRTLLSPALARSATWAGAYGPSLQHFAALPDGATLLDRVLYTDIKTYLVELLMKQDQMSMAASIESRVPFLDHKLVEFSASLPDQWKLSGLTTKRILREATKDLLPPSVLKRPKMGFPVPFATWTRGSWNTVLGDVLLDRRCRERGFINPRAVARLLSEHAEGRADGTDRLWSLFNLELWCRTFIDKEGVQTLPAPATAAHHNAHSVAQIGSPAAAR